MNDLLKMGLLAGAAYVAYEYLIAPAAATTTPVVSTTSNTVAVPVSSANMVATLNQLLANASATSNGLANISDWNYFYVQATGVVPTTLPGGDAYGLTDATNITASAYLGLLASKGLAGLNGKGMGMIVDLKSLFANVTPGTGFGAREFVSVANPGKKLSTGLGQIVDDALMSAGYIDENPFNEAAAFNGSQATPQVADFYAAVSGQGS